MDDVRPSGYELNVPPPWPWYSWVVPVALAAAIAVWQLALSHYWIGAAWASIATTWVGLRLSRLSR